MFSSCSGKLYNALQKEVFVKVSHHGRDIIEEKTGSIIDCCECRLWFVSLFLIGSTLFLLSAGHVAVFMLGIAIPYEIIS